MLAIETRDTSAGIAWHYAPLRFTGFDLTLQRHGKQVWKSLHADLKGEGHNPDYTYHVYRDRFLQRSTVDTPSSEQLR